MARVFSKLSRQLETIGIEAIPDHERRMSPWRYFLIWFMASSSATTPVIGHLLAPLGIQGMLLVMAGALLWGLLPAGFMTNMGREAPLSALVVARRPFGSHGAMLLSALFTLINVVWFGLNTEVAGELLGAALPGSRWAWVIAVGALQTILVLFGMRFLQAIYQVTFWVLLMVLGGLSYILFTSYDVNIGILTTSMPEKQANMRLAEGMAITLNFSLFAWAYKLSTVSRFCRPHGASLYYFMAGPCGIMFSMVLMGLLGYLTQTATGSWNPGLLVAHWPLVGPLVAGLLGLTIIQTNALNLYPATIDALVCLRTFRGAQWWQEPAATLLLGLLATMAALGGILSRIGGLLSWVEHLIIPFTCILLLDWYGFKGRFLAVDAYLHYSQPRYRAAGCLAFLLSVLAAMVMPGHMPDVLQIWLPEPIAVFMCTSAIYIITKYASYMMKPMSTNTP